MTAKAAPVTTRVRSEARRQGGSAVGEAAEQRHRGRRAETYLSPGQRIADRYEVVRVLGEGGMGVVYACLDPTGEACAVKRVILPESSPEEQLGWFVAEAQALAALDHENVVRARDFGQLRDGTPYLVMDLVHGVLWQQIGFGTESFAVLWTLVDQVLAGLSHVHAHGIVHGDLKPSNVMVDLDECRRPRARLFDFGLAKRRRSQLDPRLGQAVATAEAPSNAGTPGYMAPEQILGRTSEISPATDLYALGCMLYRVLSGHALLSPDFPQEPDLHAFPTPPRPHAPAGVPETVVDFTLALLVREPWRRLACAADARAEWRALRPGGERIAISSASTLLVPAGQSPAEREQTQPGLRSSHKRARKLERSRRWLPGLLSVRASPLVGRNEQQRSLREYARQLRAAGGVPQRAVVLTGPAGVGKSRLAEWLCAELEESGSALVLRGFRHAERVPRDPLALALCERFALGHGALRLLPSELAERCSGADLGAVVDWILAGRSATASLGGAALAPSLLKLLAAVARGRPLVVWLDDVAAISPETWATLGAAPVFEPDLRLLVVTTARPETLSEPSVLTALRSLKRALPVEALRVPPLDSLTTAALLRAAHPLEPALALQIALESDGIPLRALSRLHALARRGRL